MSVHSGDWKLIRLFHEAEAGAHDYHLYNLKDDIGEQTNLAKANPEVVKTLDAIMERYIGNANVVVTIPNPAFDLEKYRQERIGVPCSRHTKKKGDQAVGGWSAHGTCSVKVATGNLQIDSQGGDPNVLAEPFKRVSSGPFKVTIRMKSNASGDGAIYFNRPASAERMPVFKVNHDGEQHEYTIAIPVKALDRLRLDLARGKGTIQIDWIRLFDTDGKMLNQWDF
jgi:hypothetical protein